MSLEVRLLGPWEVLAGGRPVALPGKQRALLVALAMSAGHAVSLDRLSATMWGEDQPGNARASVQTYVTRLRGTLGADLIATFPAGYVLHADSVEVDALRFLGLLDAAAATPDPDKELPLLTEALALWRGIPFEGVRSAWLAEVVGHRLVERYLVAVERRVDLDTAGGEHLIADLRELTARNPLREPLWARLLVVLHRSGRQAEALAEYEAVRLRIAEELGSDPGPELQSIHADLLAGRTPRRAIGTPTVAVRPRAVAAPTVVPRQLPADLTPFTGRRVALESLDRFVGYDTSPVVIAAIGGVAGIGKTALAVHWAHRVAGGFDPSGSPAVAAEVVRGFLDALGVPPPQLPTGLSAQAALYRSLVAGRRMLVVLDNARDAEQVRPLIPGSPGCLVVVTSRDELALCPQSPGSTMDNAGVIFRGRRHF